MSFKFTYFDDTNNWKLSNGINNDPKLTCKQFEVYLVHGVCVILDNGKYMGTCRNFSDAIALIKGVAQ